MEDEEAVKHLFLENRCKDFEPSRQETPHLESFLDDGHGDPPTQGKSSTEPCFMRCMRNIQFCYQ